MGGGGNYSSYDVPDRSTRTSRGTTLLAEERMSRTELDPVMQPRHRHLVCDAKSPLVLACDVTGSMDVLPKIFLGKAPMVVREIVTRKYLEDVKASVCGIGDVVSDQAPLQFGEFIAPREIGDWLARIFPEGGGGAQAVESYELAAWFYVNRCSLPEAHTPFLFITGDEGFRETLTASELSVYFGGESQGTNAREVFMALRQKFMDNVFLIHRRYGDHRDSSIVRQWEGVLGTENVVKLKSDQAVADVILGVIAVVGGARTLDGYCEDMANRTDVNTGRLDPQSPQRISEVRETLKNIERLASRRHRAKGADNKITWL